MNYDFIHWEIANPEIISQCYFTAKRLHEDVNQMYDGHPYIAHLFSAYQNIGGIAGTCLNDVDAAKVFPAITFGAFFHDSIEDARQTYNDVMAIAKDILKDEEVAFMATEIVYACTNEKGRTRAERANDKYYEDIRNTPYAKYVKLADRLANYVYSHIKKSSMAKKYEQEMPHFLDAIGADELMRNRVNEIVQQFNSKK